MAPELKTSILRLLESRDRGHGLALLGWAGAAAFLTVTAFASWQFAPSRPTQSMVRIKEADSSELTGSVKPVPVKPGNGRVATVPTPLPGDPVASRDDVEALRNEVRELRRIIGRIDATSDVLARRMANLEEAFSPGSMRDPKGVAKTLPSIPSIGPATQMTPPAEPAPKPVAVTPPPVAPVPMTPPAPVMAPKPLAATPQPSAGQTTVILSRPAPVEVAAEKSALDRSAIERSTLERMLLERAPGLDPETRGLLPPAATTVVPKSPGVTAPPVVAQKPIDLAPVPPKPAMVPPAAPPVPSQAMPTPVPVPLDGRPEAAITGTVTPKPADGVKPAPAVKPPEETSKPVEALMSVKPTDAAVEPEMPPAVTAMTETTKPMPPVYGIDIGGYKSVALVKKAWGEVDGRPGRLVKGLRPLARLSEGSDGVEIRLVAGPFVTEEAARKACLPLKEANLKCAPADYRGEPLAPPKLPGR